MGKRAKTRRPINRKTLVLGGVAIVALAGLVWWWINPADPVVSLQQRANTTAIPGLANGSLKPPTNKWFSSLAFKQPSDPVFAYPLALQTMPTGFAVSYPRVVASAHTIDATFSPDITVAVAGNDIKSFIRSYDDLSVELELRSGVTVLGTMRMTQGSPYLFMQLRKGTQFTFGMPSTRPAAGIIALQRGDHAYEVAYGANSQFDTVTGTLTAQADGVEVALYAVPAAANITELRAAAQHPVTATEVIYTVNGQQTETTFTVRTKDSQPTILGLLPGQGDGKDSLGTYTTLLGTQTLHKGTEFRFTTPLPEMPHLLPLGKLTDDQHSQLANIVKHDASTLAFTATDTYFAGKQLHRAAQLLRLAKQLGLTAEATTIQSALKTELTQWFDPNTGNQRHNKYFYYDTTFKGVVGETISFGSEQFNDHHFHYGYFLSAAAVLAEYDPVFAANHKSRVTVLARDIANPSRGDQFFPYLRVFDSYAGHSWASGTAPFGAGNNQESSSEAVNAWYGVYLWATVIGDDRLKTTAQWLFARETQSALAYYLNIDQKRPELAGYAHSIVSILWSGKADYATFFDAAPESKLAIQLLPINPAAGYVASDPARVNLNLAQVARETGQAPSKFKDYLIMYKALSDPKGALADAAAISDADIDNGNSRSYLYAWLFSHQPH